MSQRNSPPLEVTPLPDIKPRKSWVPFIMGSILVGSVAMAVVFGIWGFIRLVDSLEGPGAYPSMTWGEDGQATLEKQAEYRANFRLPVATLQDADLPQVEKFLTRYITAAKYNDQGGLARLIDVDGFLLKMQEHPHMPRLDVSSRKALIAELNKSLQLPSDVTDFRLMGLKCLTKGLLLADVILKHSAGTSEPCRLWLQKRERAWSVVDWEVVRQGKSEASQWAGNQRTSRGYLGSTYASSLDDLEKADTRYYQGDLPGAISLLKTVAQQSLPSLSPSMQKQMQLAMATRYHRYRQYQLALECLRNLEEPDQVPGIFVIRTFCHQGLEEWDKAIDASGYYEKLCGFSPDVVRAKALSLVQLDKKSDATAEFKRLLEFDPSDRVALQQLVMLLPADQKGQIADLISRSKNPPETALSVAGNYVILEDLETAQAIKNLLEKKFPSSPSTHTFVARMHQHEEEFDAAAAAFRRAHAAEDDPEQKKMRWYEYVGAMNSAGKLVEAYEESPNPVEVFEHLTEGIGADEATIGLGDLPPLFEAHEKRVPLDPRLHYCRGLLAQDRNDLAAAEAAFAAGEAKATDESLKQELQFARLDVLADQGRILDAYRDYGHLNFAFRSLAARSRTQHKPNVLEELIRVHKGSHPEDAEINYYAIALDIDQGNLLKALETLQNERVGGELDGAMQRRLIELQAEAYSRYEHWESQLLSDPTIAEVLPRLAAMFEEEGNWDKLGRLLRTEKLAGGLGVLHRMKLAWHFHQYSVIESLLPNWQANLWGEVQTYEQKWARETLVRALLRQGKISAAYAFAEQFQRESKDEFPLLMVRLAQGETNNIKEMLERLLPQHRNIEQDPELLLIFTNPKYAELRRELGLDIFYGNPRITLFLFLRQKTELSEERLRQLLAGEVDVQVKLLPSAKSDQQTLAVTHPRGVVLVTVGSSPYPSLVEGMGGTRSSRHFASAGSHAAFALLKGHQAWLAIDLFDTPQALISPRDDRLARNLVRSLRDESLQAIALRETGSPSSVLAASQFRPEVLAAQGGDATQQPDWREQFSGADSIWLGLGPGIGGNAGKLAGKKAQRQFLSGLAKLPPGEFAQVEVELRQGHASEPMWLKVLRTERSDYGDHYFFCELQADSQLHPLWKTGERCKVTFWQVRETKLPEQK